MRKSCCIEADVKALAEQGFISGHAGQDRTRERVELERDRATAQARLNEAEAALAETRRAAAAFTAETHRTLADRRAKARLDLAQLAQQGAKAAQREQLTQLTAPVAGTVQQLAVHTTSRVVTPAQPLLVIVSRSSTSVARNTAPRSSIDAEGTKVRIAPGTNLSAEIKTGRRRVIEYLLSPVQRQVDESLGLR
jgi:hemolysin D